MEKEKIQLSREFKAQATQAIVSIILFILTYLTILVLAILLTVFCVVGGGVMIIFKPMLITIILGIGLASLGILILIFLVKFMFKSHKTDRSHLIEIKKSQEPELFKMINEIVLEVGTSFPKKVYLSADVNACVFYDSSFWSMFLPIKKNLQIGLGLVNTITKEELKAILSHEFGHFSQRTMKVGSYVYNVNQVIFNMLFDNEAYEKLVRKWGNANEYFLIFVSIAVKINQGIQWILRKLYEWVNKSYLALSREMEFHADEIAASITGYEPLKKSLLRMALADRSFDSVLKFYDGKITENIKSENIYNDHKAVFYFLAAANNLSTTNGLPDISLEEQSKFDKSKLVIKDQWASHPSMKDRIKRLEGTGFTSESKVDAPANEIFTDIGELQKQLTKKIFKSVSYQGNVENISTEKFIQEYQQEYLSNSSDNLYNRYYDNKNPLPFDVNRNVLQEQKADLQELYADEKVDWVYSAIALQNDMETIINISNNTLAVKTFDYDGIRYKKKDAKQLIESLKVELENITEQIRKNDIDIYDYFLKLESEQNRPKKLERLYSDFFDYDKAFDSKYDIYIKLLNGLQFVNVTTPVDQITINFQRIKPIEETLKEEIKALVADAIFANEMTPEVKDDLEQYTSKTWQYFGRARYFDSNLNVLYAAMHIYPFLLHRKFFLLKKALLTYQKELLDSHT